MLEDFDDETRETANKSPTLQENLRLMEKDGWKFRRGPAGGGSFADPKTKEVVIEQNESGPRVVGTIALESGHATYTQEPYVQPTGLTRDQYIDANVSRNLKDEGQAQFVAAQTRREVRNNGGPDTGIPGNEPVYQSVHDEHTAGKLTRDEAIDRMASHMGNETTSTTGENYRDYHGKPYADHYDQHYKGTP